MIKFGSSGIVAGYIKQLLASFNLPKAQIYSAEHSQYLEEHLEESPYLIETTFPVEDSTDVASKTATSGEEIKQVTTRCYVPYIKGNLIQFYVSGYYAANNTYVPGVWQSAPLNPKQSSGGAWVTYERGEAVKNLTKVLEIKNNIYDSYTHEYLGNYLRFIRDYDGIDLMSMYNCFSNRRPYRFKYADEYITMDTADSNYKLYVLPVKLFKDYTIAIDSAYPVEICCGIGQKDNTGLETMLTKATYQRFSSMRYGRPVLYTKLRELAVQPLPAHATAQDVEAHREKRNLIAQLGSQLDNLNLYIKLNKYTESAITILEGDYLGWNDFTVVKPADTNRFEVKANHTVIANEAVFEEFMPKLISPVQLLKFNTGTHVPFADRLLEYLLDQCITGGTNEVRENVLMAQYIMGLRHSGKVKRTRVVNAPLAEVKEANYTDANLNTKYWYFNDQFTGIEYKENDKQSFLYDKESNRWQLKIVRDETAAGTPSIVLWPSTASEGIIGKITKVAPVAIKYDFLNGVWTPELRKLFYQYMSSRSDFGSRVDILGYVDSDTEKLFAAPTVDKDGKLKSKTMLDINVWEDIKE